MQRGQKSLNAIFPQPAREDNREAVCPPRFREAALDDLANGKRKSHSGCR
jgi:hypothetical protein